MVWNGCPNSDKGMLYSCWAPDRDCGRNRTSEWGETLPAFQALSTIELNTCYGQKICHNKIYFWWVFGVLQQGCFHRVLVNKGKGERWRNLFKNFDKLWFNLMIFKNKFNDFWKIIYKLWLQQTYDFMTSRAMKSDNNLWAWLQKWNVKWTKTF